MHTYLGHKNQCSVLYSGIPESQVPVEKIKYLTRKDEKFIKTRNWSCTYHLTINSNYISVRQYQTTQGEKKVIETEVHVTYNYKTLLCTYQAFAYQVGFFERQHNQISALCWTDLFSLYCVLMRAASPIWFGFKSIRLTVKY